MRIAVIDDHPLILSAMSTIVLSTPNGHAVEGFLDLAQFDEAVAAGGIFELVLLDLGLPSYAGLGALEYFREWHDDMPVVVLSATHDAETIRGALVLGAMGFIPKTSSQAVLNQAIALVASGGVYIPPEAMLAPGGPGSRVEKSAGGYERGVAEGDDDEVVAQRITALTARQRDVLSQLLKGMPNKLICRQLGLSPNTVKSHLSAILRALNVENRTQAVIAARKWKIRVDFTRPDSRGASPARR